MAARSRWGITPGESVRDECARRGADAVVAGCIDLLRGQRADPELIVALGGPSARWAITGGEGGPEYWLRVWAARGLLYVWDESAVSAILGALTDEQWRVREMAAKVCVRHRVEPALQRLAELACDPRPRVQRAAERAMVRIIKDA